MKKIAVFWLGAIMACVCLANPVLAVEFEDISTQAGVADDGNGKGVAIADVNGDGLNDIYVSNKGGANKLYLNRGGVFTDVTEQSKGLDAPGFTMGSVFGDVDNDGCIDLYLAQGGQTEVEANLLFLGNCDGTFRDVTAKAGVGSKAFTYSASMVDYDNDGYLDIYCANYGVGARNQLYRNNGDGTFKDVTDVAGVGDPSWSWMGVWSDVNGDMLPDLYVVNGRYPAGEPNRLYVNTGKGTFREVSKEAGVADANWGLGASFADIDNDGDFDLFLSNYVGGNKLFANDGSGKFTDISDQMQGTHDGWGKGPTFGDVDHDGDLDLYEGDCKLANQLYLNNGQGAFKNVADTQPVLQCATVRTKGTAFADMDNDGDLDLYVVNWAAENKLYRNLQDDGKYLKVKLEGTRSNRSAYGAKVALYDGKKLLGVRELRSADGFCAQQAQELHFGGVQGEVTVVVTFPSGIEVTEVAKAGGTVTITEK